jgi:hypothetical protein
VEIYDNDGNLIGTVVKLHTPRDSSCCIPPIRGDIDYSGGDPGIDISDLVYLVDYMFTGGPAPECWPEANVDCSDAPPLGSEGSEDIDISDLVYLVDYMFNGGPPPCPCDCVYNEQCYPDWSGSSSCGKETVRRWSSQVNHYVAPQSGRR